MQGNITIYCSELTFERIKSNSRLSQLMYDARRDKRRPENRRIKISLWASHCETLDMFRAWENWLLKPPGSWPHHKEGVSCQNMPE